jgi:phosphoglycolate phosphatase
MSKPPPVRAILFDLDGTLVQTRESSWSVFERVNREMKLGIDTREDYFALFEQNMFVAFEQRIADKKLRQEATERFLDLLRTDYSPLIVPGMADVVRKLADHFALGIISSNAVEAICRVVRDAGLESCFGHIFGGDIEPDKRNAIRKFLADQSYATRRTNSSAYEEQPQRKLEPNEVVVVTDTIGDVLHSRECGVRVLGVTWGLHSGERLKDAGAAAVINWPQELLSWFAPSMRALQVSDAGNGEASGKEEKQAGNVKEPASKT